MMRATTLETAPDSVLISGARAGDLHAFSQLWERHHDAALRFAQRLVARSDAEDLSSEAFASILQALRNGGGPDELFRPYLYITLRNIAIRWTSRDALPRVNFEVDFDLVVDPSSMDDPTVEALDRSIVSTAFRTLPRRWQEVLWYTEVEGLKPTEVAPILGITANGVAALSYRARDGFRKAWLEAHTNDATRAGDCIDAARELERSTEISPRLAAHLANCSRCSTIAGTVDEVPMRLRMVLVPLFLGASAGGILLDLLARQAAEQAVIASIAAVPTAGLGVSGTSIVAAAHVPHVVTTVLAIATAASIGVGVLTTTTPEQAWSAPSSSDIVAVDTVGDPTAQENHGDGSTQSTHESTPPTRSPLADPQPVAPPRPTPTQPSPTPPTPVPPASNPPITTTPVIVAPQDTTPPVPPTVTSSIDPASVAPMSLSGTAEPSATVRITDGISPLAAVTSDSNGDWQSGILPVQPYTRQIVVTQTDAAGNESAPVTVDPGFRPTFLPSPLSVPHDTWVNLEAVGWPGAPYRVEMDGVPTSSGVVAPDGHLPIFTGFVGSCVPGINYGYGVPPSHPTSGTSCTIDVTFGYMDPSTSQFTVAQHLLIEVFG